MYHSPYVVAAAVLLLGASAFAVMLYATTPGLGVSPDSAFYFAGANSLGEGAGYTFPDGIGAPEPITHFPPLYSFLLYILSLTGLSVMQGARLLQAMVYAGSGVLLALLIYKGTQHDPVLAVGGAVLFLAIEEIVLIHTYMWTEGLYYFLTLLGLLLVLRAVREDSWPWLVAAASAAGLAVLTRYAGLANAAAGAAFVFLFSKGWGNKLKRAAVFGAIGVGLPALVFAWLSNRPGVQSRRGLGYHPLRSGALRATLDDIAGWLVPGRFLDTPVQWVVLGLIGAVILFLIARGLKRWFAADLEAYDLHAAAALLLAVCYLGLLTITVLFVDAQTGFGSRLLSPLIPVLIVFMFVSAHNLVPRSGFTAGHLVLLLLIPVIGFNMVHSMKFVRKSHAGSRKEYNGESWRNAEIIHWLDNLPKDTPVYSNGNDAVYFVREEPCARLPYKYSPHTSQANQTYEHELEEMRDVLEDGGVILYFPAIKWRKYLPDLDELHELYELETIFENESGVILQLETIGEEG